MDVTTIKKELNDLTKQREQLQRDLDAVSTAYSGVTRSPIPRQGDHRFRRKAVADSGDSDH
jgi:hypothetical protein